MSKKKNLIALLVVLAALAAVYFGVTAYSDYAAPVSYTHLNRGVVT